MSDLPIAKPLAPDDVAATRRGPHLIAVAPAVDGYVVRVVDGRPVRQAYVGGPPDALAGA